MWNMSAKSYEKRFAAVMFWNLSVNITSNLMSNLELCLWSSWLLVQFVLLTPDLDGWCWILTLLAEFCRDFLKITGGVGGKSRAGVSVQMSVCRQLSSPNKTVANVGESGPSESGYGHGRWLPHGGGAQAVLQRPDHQRQRRQRHHDHLSHRQSHTEVRKHAFTHWCG